MSRREWAAVYGGSTRARVTYSAAILTALGFVLWAAMGPVAIGQTGPGGVTAVIEEAVGEHAGLASGPAGSNPLVASVTGESDGLVRAVDGRASSTTDSTTRAGVSATGPFEDSDRDGIPDDVERGEYGTDPYDDDTDGDGLPDGIEAECSGILPGADPLHQDIYLEVDSVGGEDISLGATARLRAAFAAAPVRNPDGTDGITLHVDRDEFKLPENGPVNSHRSRGEYDDVLDYRSAHYDHRGEGYYYVLVASDVAYRGDDYYVGAGRSGLAAIEPLSTPRLTASLLMHELGHGFGMDNKLEGVDEERYDRSEYSSVMNYNGLYEMMDYSSGDGAVGRDEWDFVANDRFLPKVACETPGECPARCSG